VIEGSACAAVRATPGQVIAFVLDLDRYRLADTKIASARFVAGDSVGGTVVIKGRLRGLPTPPDRQHYTVSADGNTVQFRSAPSRWPGLLATFHGIVRCHPLPHGGTCVTHTERFTFTPPLALLLDPYLRNWLRRDTAEEVARMAAQLGPATGAPACCSSLGGSLHQPSRSLAAD
jgi:hypothetical protein